jgi:hypothetical protein
LLATGNGQRDAYRRGNQGYAFDFHHFAFRDWSRLGFFEPKAARFAFIRLATLGRSSVF